jgi:hypothetical protein
MALFVQPIGTARAMGELFFGVYDQPQGEDHEGTFVDYYCYRFDAQHWRIRPITERAAKNQPTTPRGAKSDQYKFAGAGSVFADCFFAEFDAVCPEHPIDAFRNTEISDHDQPVGPERDG